MKRLAFSAIALLLFCSCSYTTYETNYVGTISVLDSNGNVVRIWDNITLQNEVNGYTNINSFKSFGLNFYDPESGQHIIISNAVPYIIEYNAHTKSINHSTPVMDSEERQKLIEQYEELEELKKTYKKQLSTLEKGSDEYYKTKMLINSINKSLFKIGTKIGYNS